MTCNPTRTGWAIGIGVALGTALGAALHNLAAWIAIGAGLGLLIPYLEQRRNGSGERQAPHR